MNLDITWNKKNYSKFIKYLYSIKDLKYKKFQQKLIKEDIKIIGIRTLKLKEIAKKIAKTNYLEFIKNNTHSTYEETLIHGLIIGYLDIDINLILDLIDEFIPYINNWAINDIVALNLKKIKKNQELCLKKIDKYLKSNNTFEIRFGLVLLLNYYINSKNMNYIFNKIENIKNNNYYVLMAKAWLISICYIKEKKITLKYLKNNNLDTFTYNKAIEKIRESRQVDIKEKNYLKKLKR